MVTKSKQFVEFTMVIPGYNEEEAVPFATQKCHAALRKYFNNFEILLINDCSTDRTGEKAEEATNIYPEVRVLHNEKNLGQAMSVKKGFQKARGDVVMHNAFDLPFNPMDVGKIKEIMSESVDVLIVEREDRHSYSLYRKLISWANVTLLKTLFKCPFDDYNFVQAYRRRVLDAIPIKTKAVGSVTPELIIRSYRTGFSVKSIKLHYHERKTGQSSIRAKHVFDSFINTLKLWWYLKTGV